MAEKDPGPTNVSVIEGGFGGSRLYEIFLGLYQHLALTVGKATEMAFPCVPAAEKPHAVCMPAPFQGHLKPMLNLAKLLHHRGFHITFVNTEFNHMRILKSRGPNSLDGLPDFRFEKISDGLPLSNLDASQDVAAVGGALETNFLTPFLDLVTTKLNHHGSGKPPVTCIVTDGFLSFTYTAGEQLTIPVISFFTIAGCSLMGFKQYRTLRERGYTPLKDSSYLTNGYLDTIIDWIPGMKNMRLKDLPTFLRTTNPDDQMFSFCIKAAERASKFSTAVFINTFDELEKEVLTALASIYQDRLYTVGPIQLLLNQIPENSPVWSIGYNLWKEDSQCLYWLDSKKPGSVVYVNFGSVTVPKPEQLTELARGLTDSKLEFLWVIRPDLVVGWTDALLPKFVAKTSGQGLITSWCAQEQVLNHVSVGSFLTHCGWNSILESLSSGVPVICWPFEGDQPTNCHYCCVEWGIGIKLESDVNGEEVKRVVEEVMEGEKGKRMKRRAMDLKELAKEAAAPNGSSTINLDKVVNQLVLNVPT